jgi:hypothetical protein
VIASQGSLALLPVRSTPVSPVSPAEVRAVRGWLQRLAMLTTVTQASPIGNAKLEAMTEYLLRELPPSAFTRRAQDAILRNMKWFPPVEELRSALVSHWNATKPVTAPDCGARAQRAVRDAAAEAKAAQARRVAVRAEWDDPDAIASRVQALQGEPLASVLGRLLAAVVAASAPQHLHLIPDVWRGAALAEPPDPLR